jgi:aryl-alcohol dehydrogenase-like predicted oxidoreductase
MKGSRRGFIATAAIGGVAGLSTAGAAEAKPKEKPVDRRVFGRTGKKVSIYGLGLGSAFSNPLAGNPDGAAQMLERALDFGINYWDTARSYGMSEELIGPTLEKHRDKVFMVSKSRTRTYDEFMRELEMSLKTLRTDHLDAYYLHNWEPKKGDTSPRAREGAFKAALKAKEQGMIKAFGITGHSGADILIDCVKAFDPDAVLTIFPANRPDGGKYEDELLPLCVAKNIGVVAMKTVRHVRNSDEKPTELMRYGMSLPGVSVTIIGTGEVAHVEANAALATNFQSFDKKMRQRFSDKVAVNLPTGLPQPWDLPGYEDGMLA